MTTGMPVAVLGTVGRRLGAGVTLVTFCCRRFSSGVEGTHLVGMTRGEGVGDDKLRREARLMASSLREMNCSLRLIVTELCAKYGLARTDAQKIARDAFRKSTTPSRSVARVEREHDPRPANEGAERASLVSELRAIVASV
jgi:hypothetical protein